MIVPKPITADQLGKGGRDLGQGVAILAVVRLMVLGVPQLTLESVSAIWGRLRAGRWRYPLSVRDNIREGGTQRAEWTSPVAITRWSAASRRGGRGDAGQSGLPDAALLNRAARHGPVGQLQCPQRPHRVRVGIYRFGPQCADQTGVSRTRSARRRRRLDDNTDDRGIARRTSWDVSTCAIFILVTKLAGVNGPVPCTA